MSWNSNTNFQAVSLSSASLSAVNTTITSLLLTSGLRGIFNSNTLGNLFTTGGNVGINTKTPFYTLDVNGTLSSNSFMTGVGNFDNILPNSTTANFTNTVIMNAGSNRTHNFLRYRTGGATPGNAGVLFSILDSTHYFMYASGSTLKIDSSVETATNPGITSASTIFALSTTGNLSISGALSKGSGTFEIDHPLKNDTKLVHSFIEGPRCDLIYRGQKTLSNGNATVNIDTESVSSEYKMTPGTFNSLCANVQTFVTCNTSFEKVIGNVINGNLIIQSENQNSNSVVNWLVIGERKDNFIKKWDKTDNFGYLITEHQKN